MTAAERHSGGRRVVIACAVMRPELEAVRHRHPHVTVRYVEQSLHRIPERMGPVLQRELDAAGDAGGDGPVVLGYGLCSNGIVGLRAPPQGLAIPRVHDCIGLFLGSRAAYDRAFAERAGTYYLTPGWVAEEKDPIGVMEHDYVPRVGRADAEWALREELKHYTHIVLIDTGATDLAPLRARARENARFLGKRYEEVSGGRGYFERILAGPYDEQDFVVVDAEERVAQEAFL